MANEFDFLSPGIKIREIDESVIPAETADDGPIIIGRTRKGPAMEPIRVKSLDAFIKTFGKPAAGAIPANSDVWRDGPNTSAPTYASYAAQAWLASGNGPCTVVRLLGDQSSKDPEGDGLAGWQLSSSVASAASASNSTAYGLFIIDSASLDGSNQGALAAIFYCDSGYMTLSGTAINGAGNSSSAATFIASNADSLGFAIDVWDSSGTKQGTTNKFNFSRSSAKYIRNVFNTNPQKVNSDMTKTQDLKTYWLGETFERHVTSKVTTSEAGKQAGILLPLQRADVATKGGNWGYHRKKHNVSKTGWVISKDEGIATDFDIEELAKDPLFRFCSLHGGDDLQKDVLIAIEDIRLPSNTNVDAFATFSVSVLDKGGNVLEKFTKCNLKAGDTNFIVNKIGDWYAESWDEDKGKYDFAGSEPNHSNYIRVELAKTTFEAKEVPFGFIGPERPAGFSILSGSTTVKTLAGDSNTTAFVRGSGSVPGTEAVSGGDFGAGLLTTDQTASFVWPAIPLREAGSDGNAPNPFKAYYGIRPKISKTSNIGDVDYVDYLRAAPADYSGQQHIEAGTLASSGWEESFIFSLDDIKIDEATSVVTYVSGSRKLGTSYTAMSGSKKLLDKKVRQFVMPLYGGRHGMDITEPEPFRNELIKSHVTANGTDTTKSSQLYSVFKAIDSAADPEVAPANILIAPGFYQTDITDKVMATAQSRQDCLAIVDIEDDYMSVYESKEDISTRRGSVSSAVTSLEARTLDNTFACCFYPAVQIIDVLNSNQRVWIPSSVAGLGGIAQSEAASAAWFAPAGFNRGGLGALGGSSGPIVTQARQRLDSDDRDDLYEENINPIATFPNEGVVIFGQKTLQAGSNSALSRINVRRLLIYLKTRISRIAHNLLFDQNVPATWARFVGQAEPVLADVKARFGLTDYRLVLDENTTSDELIDKNILYAQVYLKPARAIEYIAIDFIVTRTGASFV